MPFAREELRGADEVTVQTLYRLVVALGKIGDYEDFADLETEMEEEFPWLKS